MGQVLLEAVEHLLLTPAELLALDGMRPLPWLSVSLLSHVLSVGHQQSVMEAACTWCAHAAPATFTGVGCVRLNGHVSVWVLTGLASLRQSYVFILQGHLVQLI